MSSSRKVVELFYDVVSPYSWLGFEVLCRYTALWNIDLKLRPAFLGGVMKESGNRPPAMVPNKALYLNTDLTRLAEYFGIPLHHPANPFEVMFEKGSLAAMRFLTAVAEKEQPDGGAVVERVSRELWNRIWSTDQDITQPSSFSEVQAARPPSPHQPQPGSTSTYYTAPAACNPRPPPEPVNPATLLQPFSTKNQNWNSSVHFHQSKQVLEAIKVCSQLGNQGIGSSARIMTCNMSRKEKLHDELVEALPRAGLKAGLSASEVEELLKLANSQPIKDKLKNTTQEALNYKAFGFPLIVCHVHGKPEVFFGSDRFELLAHIIGEKWLGPRPNKTPSKM